MLWPFVSAWFKLGRNLIFPHGTMPRLRSSFGSILLAILLARSVLFVELSSPPRFKVERAQPIQRELSEVLKTDEESRSRCVGKKIGSCESWPKMSETHVKPCKMGCFTDPPKPCSKSPVGRLPRMKIPLLLSLTLTNIYYKYI